MTTSATHTDSTFEIIARASSIDGTSVVVVRELVPVGFPRIWNFICAADGSLDALTTPRGEIVDLLSTGAEEYHAIVEFLVNNV